MLGCAWACLFVSAVFANFSRRLGGVFLRPILFLACLGCTGYLIVGVWHMHRIVLPYERADDAIRIVHWNHAGQKIDEQDWAKFVLDQGTDIVLISNARWGDDRQAILNEFTLYAPEDKERWVNYSYKVKADPSYFWVQDGALVASRYPMIRAGVVNFGSAARQQLMNHSSSNLGWIMFIEFNIAQDTGDDHSTIPPEPISFIVWLVDLPSDPYNARQQSMQRVRDAIESWDGTQWAMGKHVWKQSTLANSSFPEPDLIIGDFNTLRGSDSIDQLAPNMTDAFSAVGYGRGRSWVPDINNTFLRQPFKLADWHIDLALVGQRWSPTRYRIEDVSRWGSTEHRMQTLDLIQKTTE